MKNIDNWTTSLYINASFTETNEIIFIYGISRRLPKILFSHETGIQSGVMKTKEERQCLHFKYFSIRNESSNDTLWLKLVRFKFYVHQTIERPKENKAQWNLTAYIYYRKREK